MLGQLDRLLSLSADNVKIGIIPFGAEQTITPVNGFLLVHDQLIVETYGWDQEYGDESATHRRIFDMLMADALKDDEARRLIARAAEDLRVRKLPGRSQAARGPPGGTARSALVSGCSSNSRWAHSVISANDVRPRSSRTVLKRHVAD